jgi:flagella basal body P-ring formation protein FlgA
MTRFIKILLSLAACAVAANVRAENRETVAGPLTREDFTKALSGDFVSHFNLEGELQLVLLRAWSAPEKVAHQWSVDVSEFPALIAPAMLARCRVLADGQIAAEYTITLHAALWRDAWSAREPVTANTTFDPGHLEVRRVDFLRERDALPATVGDRSFIFARAIQSNRLLTWRDVARRPLVRKGDFVEVAAVDGMLQVTMKALAMENGAQGDTVTVRNPESRKDFAAQVIAENRVQIRF